VVFALPSPVCILRNLGGADQILRYSAIDKELNDGDITGFFQREKYNSSGDLVRISVPAERNGFSEIFFQLCQPITVFPNGANCAIPAFAKITSSFRTYLKREHCQVTWLGKKGTA
jgi:hypothetical protein